jgi:SHS2 domain-containing protein
MVKHCETFDHTADVGLACRGETLGELFEAMAEGVADLICPRDQVARTETRNIRINAEDLEALAVDFLAQVAVTIQTDRFVVASVAVRRISETEVAAEIAGERLDPGRHEFHTEVKAVTYHLLHVAREGDGWVGRVILDI